jgi:hypothetical protein
MHVAVSKLSSAVNGERGDEHTFRQHALTSFAKDVPVLSAIRVGQRSSAMLLSILPRSAVHPSSGPCVGASSMLESTRAFAVISGPIGP